MASSVSFNGGDSLPLSHSQGLLLVVSSICILYFVITFGLFGSSWPPYIIDMYNKKSVLNRRYAELFQARDNLLYHISWSKADGNLNDARRMMKELENVDRDIDALEEEYGVLVGVRRKSNKIIDNSKNI